MNRYHPKGVHGDAIHAVLCAEGYNIRWPLRMIRKKGVLLYLILIKMLGLDDLRGCEKLAIQSRRVVQTASIDRVGGVD
jgi:hypothetical protein